MPYLADRSVTNMTDFGNVSQTEDVCDIGRKNLRRPKLDLSFASYGGYQIPQQQYRVSPTFSDGSDPLISHLMIGSRSNTPDDSDISNSPETVADLIVGFYNFFIPRLYLLSSNYLIFRIKLILILMVHLH